MEAVAPNNYNDDSSINDNNKREFLKRKSKKQAIAPAPPKKYNYYVDNFDEGRKKDKDSANETHLLKDSQPAKIQSYEVHAPSSKPQERY